ncbi:MAG TPA: DUF3574 domain-containing protein [Myxococcales bacterium]|nr:DUF3574 domain-containing protein [Myxococcales bacterium]
MRAAALSLLLFACATAQVQSTLFFGLSRPGGPDVSAAEFDGFVETQIAPRFPDGFTLLEGAGRWREAGGRVRSEPSRLLIVVHAPGDADRLLREIAASYRDRFGQEAVLQTDARVDAVLHRDGGP